MRYPTSSMNILVCIGSDEKCKRTPRMSDDWSVTVTASTIPRSIQHSHLEEEWESQ